MFFAPARLFFLGEDVVLSPSSGLSPLALRLLAEVALGAPVPCRQPISTQVGGECDDDDDDDDHCIAVCDRYCGATERLLRLTLLGVDGVPSLLVAPASSFLKIWAIMFFVDLGLLWPAAMVSTTFDVRTDYVPAIGMSFSKSIYKVTLSAAVVDARLCGDHFRTSGFFPSLMHCMAKPRMRVSWSVRVVDMIFSDCR